MNPDPLAALRPLHLPEAVGWWPPAPLWWLVALLVCAGVFFAIRAVLQHLHRNRYRRAARRELADALQAMQANGDAVAFVACASSILRRAALRRYPHAEVAPLHGRDWLLFLDRSARMTGFADGPGDALGLAAYAPASRCNPEALARLCHDWLRRHR